MSNELGIHNVVKMSSNESAFGVSEKLYQILCNTASQLHLYPASGDTQLCEKMADRLGIDSRQIIMGNGSDAVIYNLGMTIIEPGDEVIIPEITFLIYKTITQIMGGKIVTTPMKNLRIDMEAILDRITDRTKAIFLCNPNNPTGDTLDPDSLHRFIKAVPEKVLVVLDEAYIEFVDRKNDPRAVELFRSGIKNIFLLRTFSKSYGIAGIRLGYGIGDETVISYMNRVKQPFEVSLPAQKVGLAALDDQLFVNKVVKSTQQELQYFYTQLDRFGVGYMQSQANFILIDTGTDANMVCEELEKWGVIVRPGTVFGLTRHIRVTIGTRRQNEQFLQAFKRIISSIWEKDQKDRVL